MRRVFFSDPLLSPSKGVVLRICLFVAPPVYNKWPAIPVCIDMRGPSSPQSFPERLRCSRSRGHCWIWTLSSPELWFCCCAPLNKITIHLNLENIDYVQSIYWSVECEIYWRVFSTDRKKNFAISSPFFKLKYLNNPMEYKKSFWRFPKNIESVWHPFALVGIFGHFEKTLDFDRL